MQDFPFESFIPVLFIALFVLMFAGAIFAGIHGRKQAKENLRQLADRLGLTVSEPTRSGIAAFLLNARVQGAFRGRPTEIFTYSTGSGKQRTTWSALEMQVENPGGLTFKLTTENLFTKAGRMFGVDDVKTGDAAFDGRFYIKSNAPAFISAALIPEVRMRLQEIWTTHKVRGSFTVEGTRLKYAEVGSLGRKGLVERFAALADVALQLTEVVSAHRG